MFECLNVFKTNQNLIGLTVDPKENETNYSNKFLDQISIYFPNVLNFTGARWSATNFDFLFKFNELNDLKLILRYPIETTTLIDLFDKFKLTCLNIFFLECDDYSKDKLSSFKKTINDHLMAQKRKNVEFKIQIHRHKTRRFIRYYLHDLNLSFPSNLPDSFVQNYIKYRAERAENENQYYLQRMRNYIDDL